MILWTIKLLNTARRAIAGRKHPHQLAWGFAFGLFLGIVPHGNLLAVALVVLIVTLKLNHAMAGLTAVATTLGATMLDPFSHRVGDYVLSSPSMNGIAVRAWELPLVPWTDLNNTVVMGSFLIGAGALLPIFAMTYPVFRLWAPQIGGLLDGEEADRESNFSAAPRDSRTVVTSPNNESPAEAAGHPVVMFDSEHSQASPPHAAGRIADADLQPTADAAESQMAVETRIDVIRLHRDPPQDRQASSDGDSPNSSRPKRTADG